MTVAGRRHAHRGVSEETVAAARVVLGLTIAVGGMTSVIGAATGQSIMVAALPTAMVCIGVLRRVMPLAGWAGVVVWLLLVPSVHGEALLAPGAMSVLCAAIAIGPDRFASWVGRDFAGGAVDRRSDAWIEEDGRRLE
jgi:hypothetical protein